MSKFAALYYPTFEPPANWLRSFLLFYDTISTIVPAEAEKHFSEDFLRLIDVLPDAYASLRPNEEDIKINVVNLERLEKAFEIISEKTPITEKGTFKVVTNFENGGISIEGHCFMHDRKISNEVRELLTKFNLIRPEMKDFVEGWGLPDYSIVNIEASDLLLSHVADKIGSREGLSTVTDKEIDFAINSLNALVSARSPRNVAADKLACSIITCEVPEEIQFVEPKKYKAIRDAFKELRKPFHKTIFVLTQLHRLDDMADVSERVKEITDEFDQEIQDLKKSHFGRQMRRWVPLGVGALSSLISGAVAGRNVAISNAAVSVVIQIIQELNGRAPDSEEITTQRLIGRMQKKVVDAGKIKRLL